MVWKAGVPKWHQQTDTDVLRLENLALPDLELTGFQSELLNISYSPCRSQEEGCGIHGGGARAPPCLDFRARIWKVALSGNKQREIWWGRFVSLSGEGSSEDGTQLLGLMGVRSQESKFIDKANEVSYLRPPSEPGASLECRTLHFMMVQATALLILMVLGVKLSLPLAGPPK